MICSMIIAKKSWPFCEMSVMGVQGKEDIKKLETVVNW